MLTFWLLGVSHFIVLKGILITRKFWVVLILLLTNTDDSLKKLKFHVKIEICKTFYIKNQVTYTKGIDEFLFSEKKIDKII